MANFTVAKEESTDFVSAKSSGGIDPLTQALINGIKDLAPNDGNVIKLECATAKEARGIGRRVSFALKALKLPEDSVILNAFNAKDAEAFEAKGSPIIRKIKRVK